MIVKKKLINNQVKMEIKIKSPYARQYQIRVGQRVALVKLKGRWLITLEFQDYLNRAFASLEEGEKDAKIS